MIPHQTLLEKPFHSTAQATYSQRSSDATGPADEQESPRLLDTNRLHKLIRIALLDNPDVNLTHHVNHICWHTVQNITH